MIALDPRHFLGHWALGVGLVEIGASSDAVASSRRLDDLSGGVPITLGFLAYGCGRAGRSEDARRLLERAEKLATAAYMPPSTFALGYVGLGDWDAALHWMDKAIDGRDPIIVPIKTFPFLDPIRGDARFQALLTKMRLE